MLRSRSLIAFSIAGCTQPTETVDALPERPLVIYDQVCAPGTMFTGSFDQGCPAGKVEDVPYYYPLRDGAEFLDITYMDSPNGDSPQTYPAGVRYDFDRDGSEGSSFCDGVHSQPGGRDYMGNDTTYDLHNGYDNSIEPARVVIEGGGLVYPMAPGIVAEVSPSGWETTITIVHSNGFKSWYTHLLSGSEQVRENDRVDRTTPLGQIFGAKDGGPNEHLHYALDDCTPTSSTWELSFYEVFRADRHLMALKPLYDSGPSDASDLVISLETTAGVTNHDHFRFRRGETVQLMGTGQWRTTDQLAIELVDPNGGVHGLMSETNIDLGRGNLFRKNASYTIGAADPLGYWTARVVVNGAPRVVKHIKVTAAGSVPDANGPVRSAAAVVSSGADNVRAYYRSDKGTLFSFRWRAKSGWDYMTHANAAPAGAPSCVQRDTSLVDCFYRGSEGDLHRWASTDGGNSGTESDIYSLPGAGDPSAFSTGPSSLEVAFSDKGKLALLHFDGNVFKLTQSAEDVAQAPSCVVEDAARWRCYAKAPSGALREVPVINGVVAAGADMPTGSQWTDVQALLLPQPLDQKFHIVVVDQPGGAMRHRTQVVYQNNATKWLSFWDGSIGAFELSTPSQCVVRPGTSVPECFAADLDHNLMHTTWTGTRWLPWEPILLTAMDRQAPTLATGRGDQMDVYYAGSTPNSLVQRTQIGNIWGAEQSLAPADNAYAPGCETRGGATDCFTVSSAGAVTRRIFSAGSWTVQSPLALGAASSVSPVATSSSAGSAIFLDTSGNLVEQAFTSTSWSGSSVVVGKPAGATLVDAPGCTSRWTPPVPGLPLPTTIDCFARTADGRLATITKTNAAWGAWSFVPNAHPRSAPSAVSLAGTDNVFFRGTDNVLVQLTGATSTWSDPAILGGSIASAPACAARTSPTRIDCVAQGFRSLPQDLVHYSYQATIGWILPHGLGTGLANLALHKPATQSSEYTPSPAPASRAVDGTIDGNFNNGSVTHTSNTSASWWQVDLGAIRSVDHVQVFNRTDAAVARLAGFFILLSNDGLSWFAPSGPAVSFDRTRPIPFPGTYMPVKHTARFVRVMLPAPEYLHLAEVMVMGREQQ